MTKSIRLKFLFRKEDQKKWYTDFFLYHLEQKYQVIIDEESPDFIFHEAHLIDVIRYPGVRIAIAGENVRTDFNISDYGIGFDHLTFQDRYLRFPLYLFYTGSLNLAFDRQSRFEEHNIEDLVNRKFCNFLVSNGNATEFRTQFFHLLSNYKAVDSGGKYLNTIGALVKEKASWQKEYKFSLSFENSSTSGYLTEKLIHAYAANTVPIYWGDPDAFGPLREGKGGINSDAVILVDENYPERAVEEIKELDRDSDKYWKKFNQPLFIDPNHKEIFEEQLKKFLFTIFDQEKQKAFRRGFGQIRMRVEKRNIARSSVVTSLMNYIKRRVGK